MLNPPNSLSLLRGPLALFFLSQSTTLRTIAVIVALFTDCIDGYLARKYKYTSKLGAILDPLMDKFFVYFALAVLMIEGSLGSWQALLMISRDLFILGFALLLLWKKTWRTYPCRSVIWGKVTTGLQFLFIILLTYHLSPPAYLYFCFPAIGFLVFIELSKSTNSA